jgi:hypothetical protein
MIENLLTRRFEVLAPYPDSTRAVGSVIEIPVKDKEQEWINRHIAFYKRFPHLFKELKWWEKRGRNDVEYIKNFSLEGKLLFVDKVEYWDEEHGYFMLDSSKQLKQVCTPAGGEYPTLPATRTEYDEYLINKSK